MSRWIALALENSQAIQFRLNYNRGFLKRILINKTVISLLFFLIIMSVFFISIELVLRSTHSFGAHIGWAEPDPVLKWRNTPSNDYWFFKENDHPITGKFNSYGWRDKEWSIAKPIDTYRIAVLGDSFVESLQVESDRTFLALVEKELNKISNRPVELMNFGRSGFTQTEELIVLQNEITQFDPDMVLLLFLPDNDIEDVSRETASGVRPYYILDENGQLKLDTSFSKTLKYKIRSLINPIKQRSALVSLITERYNAFLQQKRINKGMVKNKKAVDNKISGFLSLCTSHQDPRYVTSYNLNKRLIKEMSEYSRQKGIKFVLVTTDIISHKSEVKEKYKSIDPSFDTNFFEDDLGKLAKSLDIEYLGLQRVFSESYKKTGTPLRWGHWNYQGHKLVANTLTKKLGTIVDTHMYLAGLTK